MLHRCRNKTLINWFSTALVKVSSLRGELDFTTGIYDERGNEIYEEFPAGRFNPPPDVMGSQMPASGHRIDLPTPEHRSAGQLTQPARMKPTQRT